MELKGVEGGDRKRGVGGEMRREKSLRIGEHNACGVVWGPVYRTHLVQDRRLARGVQAEHDDAHLLVPEHLVERLLHGRHRVPHGGVAIDAVGAIDETRRLSPPSVRLRDRFESTSTVRR